MNDVVTKPLLYIHETRRRSDGHVDGVTVASRRVDAIDANLKFRKVQKTDAESDVWQTFVGVELSSVDIWWRRAPLPIIRQDDFQRFAAVVQFS